MPDHDERGRPEEGVNAATRRFAKQGAERDIGELEARVEAMLRRFGGMERTRKELEGWEGFPAVAAAWAEGEPARTRSKARDILELAASLRRKLGLPAPGGS